MTIGESLKRFRTSLGLSQKRFAESLDVACSLYQVWEYDKSVPSAKTILKIADKYNVSTDYLLGRSDVPNPSGYDEREVQAAFEFRDKWQAAFQLLPNMAWQAGTAGAIAQ